MKQPAFISALFFLLYAAASLAEPVESIIPSATTQEVSDELVSGMTENGWTVDKATADIVKLSIILPIKPGFMRSLLCEKNPSCMQGQRVQYQLFSVGSDVKVLTTSEMTMNANKPGVEYLDSTEGYRKRHIAGMVPLIEYFSGRASKNNSPHELTQNKVAKETKNKSFNNLSIAELKAQATILHPAALYLLSTKLMAENKLDDSVFWFYVGQLRFRFHLAANPGLSKSGDPALFSSLQDVVGSAVNQYAGGDSDNWARLIKKARKWDISNPNDFTSKKTYKKEYKETLSGMDSLVSYIENNKKKIKAERKENGL